MGDAFRRQLQNCAKVHDSSRKRLVNLEVLEIADMLAEKSPVAAGQAHRIFQFGADCQNRSNFGSQGDGPRDEAT